MKTDSYPIKRDDVDSYFSRPADELSADLDRRVLGAIRTAYKEIPFYQRMWDEHGVDVHELRSTRDISRLPTCSIDDFRASIEKYPPFGDYFNQTEARCGDLVLATGGTTGAPRPILSTATDRVLQGQLAARVWNLIGVTKDDLGQILSPFSLHGASWIGLWGLQTVGARILPTGGGKTTPTVRQVELMARFGTSVLLSLPSYIGIISDTAIARGIDPRDLRIRRILVGAEVLTPRLRTAYEATWGAKVFDVYGSMDTLVWSSSDCEVNREAGGTLGSHVWSDAIHVEILREDGSACDPGEYGDLTFTSWLCSVGPKIRFRTGDRAAFAEGTCPCGIKTPRLLPLRGRMDDRLRIGGVNFWPTAIESALVSAIPDLKEYAVVARTDSGSGRDRLEVIVERTSVGDHQASILIEDSFKASFGVTPRVRIVTVGETARLTGRGDNLKVRRVFDERENPG